jgi:hypothetical protein
VELQQERKRGGITDEFAARNRSHGDLLKVSAQGI